MYKIILTREELEAIRNCLIHVQATEYFAFIEDCDDGYDTDEPHIYKDSNTGLGVTTRAEII